MTAILAAGLPPVDACPSCDPGIPSPSLPVGPVQDIDGGTLADYECGSCGGAWSTRFDAYGWVVERTAADITEVREAA